jgi:hypothetical protein
VTFTECYNTLKLRPGASMAEAHAAYKRLALRHHPDRNGDDPENRRLFCLVTEAYARLRTAHHARTESNRSGECPACKSIGELFVGLHGRLLCADCLLGKRRRYLPMPTYRQIRCLAAVLFLCVAAVCLVRTAIFAEPHSAFAGFGCVLVAMASLGLNVLSADIIES